MPLGKEVGIGPGHIALDGDPVGTQPTTAAPPHFRPVPIVAKRSPISATAELLYRFIHDTPTSQPDRQTDTHTTGIEDAQPSAVGYIR